MDDDDDKFEDVVVPEDEPVPSNKGTFRPVDPVPKQTEKKVKEQMMRVFSEKQYKQSSLHSA